jgi:hypothetical protein
MTNIETYLQCLTETAAVKGAKSAAELNKDLTSSIEPLSIKDVEGTEDIEEAPEHLQGENVSQDNFKNKEGVKYNIMNKENAFDRLFKHAINEDFDEMDPAGDSGLGGSPGGLGGEEDFGDDMGMGGEGDIDAEAGHVGKVKEVIDLLQQALEKLTAFEGEEEEEYDEYEGGDDTDDFGGDDFGGGGDDEPVTEEEVDAETLGHAIVDVEKLKKGMDKPGNMKVSGAVPNAGKKAQAPAGQKNDGTLSSFSDAGGKKLQGKGNMKVPGRASNVKKTIFDS